MGNRIKVDWFEGLQYWLVKLDDEMVFTSSDRYEAFMFAAELIGRLKLT